MRRNFVFVSFLGLLSIFFVISCGKKNKNVVPVVNEVNMPNPGFSGDASVDGFSVQDLSDKEKSIYSKILSSEPISFELLTEAFVEMQNNEYNAAVAPDRQNLAELHSFINMANDNLDSSDLFTFKGQYESNIERSKGQIKYNKSNITLGHIAVNNKLQCYSGTSLNQVLMRKHLKAQGYEDRQIVVIYEPGHILSGYFDNDQLVGIETTAAGKESKKSFGKAEVFQTNTRVIEPNYWMLLEIFKSKLSAEIKTKISNFIITYSAQKYKIDLSSFTQSSSSSSSSKEQTNSSPLAFGDSHVPGGDLDRMPMQNIGGSSYNFVPVLNHSQSQHTIGIDYGTGGLINRDWIDGMVQAEIQKIQKSCPTEYQVLANEFENEHNRILQLIRSKKNSEQLFTSQLTHSLEDFGLSYQFSDLFTINTEQESLKLLPAYFAAQICGKPLIALEIEQKIPLRVFQTLEIPLDILQKNSKVFSAYFESSVILKDFLNISNIDKISSSKLFQLAGHPFRDFLNFYISFKGKDVIREQYEGPHEWVLLNKSDVYTHGSHSKEEIYHRFIDLFHSRKEGQALFIHSEPQSFWVYQFSSRNYLSTLAIEFLSIKTKEELVKKIIKLITKDTNHQDFHIPREHVANWILKELVRLKPSFAYDIKKYISENNIALNLEFLDRITAQMNVQLIKSSALGELSDVKKAIDGNADVNHLADNISVEIEKNYEDLSGLSALMVAVIYDHKEVVEYLLTVEGININLKSKNGLTAVDMAKNSEMLSALIGAGGVSGSASNGSSSFSTAGGSGAGRSGGSSSGNYHAGTSGNGVGVYDKNKNSCLECTALHIAITEENLEMLGLLLKAKASTQVTTKNGWLPIDIILNKIAVKKTERRLAILAALIRSNSYAELTDYYQILEINDPRIDQSLIDSVQPDNLEIAAIALMVGNEGFFEKMLNLLGSKANTELSLKVDHNVSMFDFIRQFRHLSLIAAYYGRTKSLQLLVERDYVFTKSVSDQILFAGNDILQAMLKSSNFNKSIWNYVISQRVKLRVNLNQTNDDLQNLAHLAVLNNNVEFLKLLLEQKGFLGKNRKDDLGRTPMMIAIDKGNDEAQAVLLNAGANKPSYLDRARSSLKEILD